MANIFLGVKNVNNNTTEVYPARDYQASSYLTFMSNKYVESINFNYPGNIVFEIKKFNGRAFQGEYSSFCILKNVKNEEHILSNEEDVLRGFVGWKNRLTTGGGRKKTNKKSSVNRKKKTNRKKLSKRK